MYSKGYYARKKFFSSLGHMFWSAIMFVITALLIAAFVWGCVYWWGNMGPAIE